MSALSSVIAIDLDAKLIQFYTPRGEQAAGNNTLSAGFNTTALDDEFMATFDKTLKAYRQRRPSANLSKTALILPDQLFLTDMLNIPAIQKKVRQQSLELAAGTIYKNLYELKYHTFPLAQNKQFATYGLVGVRKDLVTKLLNVCVNNRVGVQCTTFAAGAMASGAMALNPKLRNNTFLLLDIKSGFARFAFVNKGRVLASFSLPFGYSILQTSKVMSEDLLFDHAGAELLVLNAKEKAKAKQITMMGEEVFVDSDLQKALADGQTASAEDGGEMDKNGKKTGKKLPKYMLRDLPETQEGFVYENFRIFLKWALNLLANNPHITSLEAIDTVYVNMPRELDFLYPMINSEAEENGVTFAPLLTGSARNNPEAKKLELYGAQFISQFNKVNNF